MTALQYYLGVSVFALFILSVAVRAVLLRRQGIQAFLFGETHKTDFILVPCVLFVIYVVLANTFGWPVLDLLVARFWASEVPGWVGLGLCLVALFFFWYTLASFGKSFRVGIDENSPAELVTSGAFALSRNPIYVCFLVFFAGLYLVQCNVVLTLTLVAFAMTIHRQILREEAFLSAHYGKEYEEYQRKVQRYL